jgi:hypothetical protein
MAAVVVHPYTVIINDSHDSKKFFWLRFLYHWLAQDEAGCIMSPISHGRYSICTREENEG